MRRTCVTSLYPAAATSRWVHAAAATPDNKLWQQCVGQWKRSPATRAATLCQRLALTQPLFPCARQFDPRRK